MKVRGSTAFEFLADGAGDLRAGAFGQRAEFAERVFAGDSVVEPVRHRPGSRARRFC